MKGFASGFLGEKIEDIGTCGSTAVSIVQQLEKVVMELFSGRMEKYMAAFSDFITIITLIPQEFKSC